MFLSNILKWIKKQDLVEFLTPPPTPMKSFVFCWKSTPIAPDELSFVSAKSLPEALEKAKNEFNKSIGDLEWWEYQSVYLDGLKKYPHRPTQLIYYSNE